MPQILVLSAGDVFKADLIEQIRLYAPDFTILDNDAGLADVIVIDEDKAALANLLKQQIKAPLIFLSAQDDPEETASYQIISKPFKLSQLLDLIRASISIFENSAGGCLEFNDYVLYPSRKEIVNLRNNETTKLTEKEVAVIKYLYKNKDKIIAKGDLMQEVWGYAADVATHTVETHIYRLRQKVEHDDVSAQLILTSDGGYQLKV